ncbi:hypothetical protein D6792_00900 [Candidatus Parcubacteria bacterium]|nr:MAG: hypothetical protein D6792_00900 [Candidatus Parcubacteria bacterium]GIW68611.1 MAG: hypothetical protein KatS3mg100_105 [Candidatus Parcubacteria bacterium]
MPHFGEGGRKPKPSGLQIAGIPEEPVEQAVFLLEQWVAICEPLMRQNNPSTGDSSSIDEFELEECTWDRGQTLFAHLIDQIQESNQPLPLTQTLFNICAQKPEMCRRLLAWGIINPTFFEVKVEDKEISDRAREEEKEEQTEEDNTFLLRICLSSRAAHFGVGENTGDVVFEIQGGPARQTAQLYALLTALVAFPTLLTQPQGKAILEAKSHNLLLTKTFFNHWEQTRRLIPPHYTVKELRRVADFLDEWQGDVVRQLLLGYLEAPAPLLDPQAATQRLQEWHSAIVQHLS